MNQDPKDTPDLKNRSQRDVSPDQSAIPHAPSSGAHKDTVKDPLGVIEKCARELFEDRGRPEGKQWTDFVPEAEQLLLAGRTEAPPTQERPHISAIENLPPRIWALRDQDTDPFAAAVASSVGALLSEHESFCMGVFLHSNEFQLSNGGFRTCSTAQIAALLSELAGEYEAGFIQGFASGEIDAIPVERRREYWEKKLKAWIAEDRPLNYADRNTIDRICNALRAQPGVTGIRLRPLGDLDS
ncbi:MAG: hypothetical protein U0136_18790 [Bdellovibrionota bacterium]